jgi:hypothetical protein
MTMARQTGRDFAEISGMPEFTKDVEIMWNEYLRVNKGCDRITYSEIASYQTVTGKTLTPWEIDLMLDIDILRRSDG